MAVYSSGSQEVEWREVEGGELPRPMSSLRASLVDDVLFVTGGLDDHDNFIPLILSWDPVAESWQPGGSLAVARHWHAAVAVPASLVQC